MILILLYTFQYFELNNNYFDISVFFYHSGELRRVLNRLWHVGIQFGYRSDSIFKIKVR